VKPVLIVSLDHIVLSRAAANHGPAHISRLRESAKAALDQINSSLESIQSSMGLLAEIERLDSSLPSAREAFCEPSTHSRGGPKKHRADLDTLARIRAEANFLGEEAQILMELGRNA
jgi:hypothetical protein